jgi:hypothetical protein
MLQFLSTLWKRLSAAEQTASSLDEREAFYEDPLSHPELKAMSPRELADIPFAAWREASAKQTVSARRARRARVQAVPRDEFPAPNGRY